MTLSRNSLLASPVLTNAPGTWILGATPISGTPDSRVQTNPNLSDPRPIVSDKTRITKLGSGEWGVYTLRPFDSWKLVAIAYDYKLARKIKRIVKDLKDQ